MKRIFGAECSPGPRVDTHLFLLSPNNSGSTFLVRCLGLCRNAWSLHREGQVILGFAGPTTRDDPATALIWAATEASRARFEAPGAFDWARTRKAWHFAASAAHEGASVFVTKSPPHLLVADQLATAFAGARFLVMVRNPYAIVEGVLRNNRWETPSRAERIGLAAGHVLHCFRALRRTLDIHGERSLYLTYEAMCGDPAGTAARIAAFVPALDDLALDRRVPVKGTYDEPLRDMNRQQIARLTAGDIASIRDVLLPEAALLGSFGYDPADARLWSGRPADGA